MITAKVDYKVKRGHKYQITNLAWQTYPFPKYMDFDSLHTHGFHETSKYASVTRVTRT